MAQHFRLTGAAWQRVSRAIQDFHLQVDRRDQFTYSWCSTFYSLLFKLQATAYEDSLKKVGPLPPIFLLGFWRSGTTFLHELFSCDKRLGFPSTYACLNPTHFLLSESWIGNNTMQQQVQRAMDKMKYSWISPQEDEFALMILGAASPYLALVTPSLMSQPNALLDPNCLSPAERQHWAETLHLFIRMVSLKQPKTILLKSPPHGYRMPLLPSFFPGARFVIVERNPYEVFASNLKLWRTLLQMYSLEPFDGEQIENFVLAAYVIHEKAIHTGVPNVGPGSIARVYYEDLIENPQREMARLYSELELENFEKTRPELERYVRSVADHTRNRFTLSQAQMNRLEQAWGGLIKDKRYTSVGDHIAVNGTS